MRRLLLTTASVIALGLGGIGFASAQQSNQVADQSGSVTPPAASTQTPTQTQTPSQAQSQAQSTKPMSTHRTMRMGRGEVTQAQRQLRAENLYRGRIDGRLGPETRTALRRFQQHNHLPVTARLDTRTMSSLMGGGTMGQGSSRMSTTTHNRTMGQGSSRVHTTSQPSSTMGQGSSTQPDTTQMTPPTGQMPNSNPGSDTTTPSDQTTQPQK